MTSTRPLTGSMSERVQEMLRLEQRLLEMALDMHTLLERQYGAHAAGRDLP